MKLGDLFNRHPDVTPAQALYDQAFAIDVRLAQDYPASRHFVDNLAWSYDRLGHLAMRQADHARAEALFERRCQTNLRLLKLDPGNLTTAIRSPVSLGISFPRIVSIPALKNT